MRLALLGPRVRRTLYKQDRADDTNSIKSDDCCEKEQNLEDEPEEQSTSKKTEEPSEAGATTETPETEVENNAEQKQGSEIVKTVPVSERNPLISQRPVKENLKIKSKVSIILREPKCPSQLNNGFSQVRTACQ
jgi:cobalamin-dependent methionine synthase I